MANKKITELTEITTPAVDDPLAIINGGLTKQVKKSNLFGKWTDYTPTVTAGSGTFTTVTVTGRFMVIGKTCWFKLQVVITTNGTAATDVRPTLPVAAVAGGIPSRAAGGLNGSDALLSGFIVAGSSVLAVKKYDGTYPGADGVTFQMWGAYETA